jgi:hypothetical protein
MNVHLELKRIESELPEFRNNLVERSIDITQIKRMKIGWQNEAVANDEYCVAMLEELFTQKPKTVLECGSGFTTILLAVAAAELGFTLTVIDHSPVWSSVTRKALTFLNLPVKSLYDAPLLSYGAFDWYDIAAVPLQEPLDFVICDGPPGVTRGGRVGLFPVLELNLSGRCVILLDDAERAGEQEVLKVWQSQFGTRHTFFGDEFQYAIVRVKNDLSDTH